MPSGYKYTQTRIQNPDKDFTQKLISQKAPS